MKDDEELADEIREGFQDSVQKEQGEMDDSFKQIEENFQKMMEEHPEQREAFQLQLDKMRETMGATQDSFDGGVAKAETDLEESISEMQGQAKDDLDDDDDDDDNSSNPIDGDSEDTEESAELEDSEDDDDDDDDEEDDEELD